MRGRAVISTALFFCAAMSAGAAQEVRVPEIDFGRYHALVIGNNDYKHLPELTTAVGDANAVAELLQTKYGFQITKLVNATRRDITSAFNDLRKSLTERDNLLVYYAGHGVLDIETETGFWQPIDAEPNDDSNWLPNTALTRYLKAISARHVMVVADSCYAGTITRGTQTDLRSGAEPGEWIRRLNTKRSRTALVSGGLEPVLDGGGGRNSVFAKVFLDTLRDMQDVVEGHTFFSRLSRQVVINADQTPEYSDIRFAGHEGGDFLFVPLDVKSQERVSQRAQDVDREALFWQSIQGSKNPAMFQAYLEKYPNGEFAPIARLELEAAQSGAHQRLEMVEPPTDAGQGETESESIKPTELALAPAPPAIPTAMRPAVGTYDARPDEGFRDCADCPEMIVVPAGSFMMGSLPNEDGRDGDEGSQHRVTIPRAFALGKYEVSFAEWDLCVQEGGCRHRPHDQAWGRDDRPAINVNLHDAQEFVRWLSRKSGREYALPSEAQWEYAARAGTTTPYSWGASVGLGKANCKSCGSRWDDRRTAPVGSFKSNPFGLHDMLGNVWEWTADCLNRSYAGAPNDGRAWEVGDCDRRIVRGGSWGDAPNLVRSASRDGIGSDERFINLGFRVARGLP